MERRFYDNYGSNASHHIMETPVNRNCAVKTFSKCVFCIVKNCHGNTVTVLKEKPSHRRTTHRSRLELWNQVTYLQVSNVALAGGQTPQDDRIVGVEVGDEFTGDGGDF